MPRNHSLFQFKRGDHTCVFYNDDAALLEVLTPYVAEGLRNGERCFCVQKEHIIRRLDFELRFLGVDIEREMKRGALELHAEREVYFPSGSFEPAVMMDLLRRSIEAAAEQGFTAFRSAGELAWAAQGHHRCDQLVGYEKMVDEYYPGRPAIGICQYPIADFAPEVLQAVLEVHRQALQLTAPGSNHSSLRLFRGYHSADIVSDRRAGASRYDYVVQNRMDHEILGWGSEPTLDDATHCVEALFSNAAQHHAAGGLVH